MSDRLYVAVCGGEDAGQEDLAAAETVGRLLARASATLVCGGGAGVMEAAARGASAEGGVSVGVLPGPNRTAANRHLTVSLPTAMGEMRNVLVVRAADALIAIAGEFGTLSEIAFAVKTGVPVVGLRTWELARDGKRVDAFVRVDSPERAVDEALRLARERRAQTPRATSGA
jgi:uncharacterized protein (TIGR00725 family)